MIDVLFQTLPFFAVIGLGYGAARAGAFPPEAGAWLTRFVFYFALPAMLLRFSSGLSLAEVVDWSFIAAYLAACFAVYAVVTAVAVLRRVSVAEASVEAQCGVIGNTGFLGVPMLAMLMGPAAIGPVVLVLACDLIVFGSIIVILITGSREGRVRLSTLKVVARGLLANPMIMAITLGFAWAGTGWAVPGPVFSFLDLLGAAATPGALFAIGASLADKSAERMSVAIWLSVSKLVLHPAAVAVSALWLFDVAPFDAGVMIAAAALPVAGNIYILAQHYRVAPQRVSASILVSTAASIVTVTTVIAWVAPLVAGGGGAG